MINYAMIPINRKYDKEDKRHVRRILISYREKFNNEYLDVKVVDKDPYFKDPNSSHQYVFEEEGYKMIKNSYINNGDNHLIDELRPYLHIRDDFYDISIEFKAKSDDEAIKIFNERDELR